MKYGVAALAIASVGWVVVYLWLAVPGRWFSNSPMQRFSGAQMNLTRGVGASDGTRFVVRATDPSGLAVITIDTPTVIAEDYRRIRWKVVSVDPTATLVTAWRSPSAAGKTLVAPVEQYGGDFYIAYPRAPDWSGRIEGIALTIRGTLRQPLFVEEVTIDPMDASDIASDRMHDWFGFRYWNGLSINSAIGGPLEQPVFLPVTASLVALTAIAILLLRWRKRMSRPSQRLAIVMIVGITWLVLDGRWLWLRMQQTQETGSTFSGKTPHDKHLADIDSYLYAFSEQVLARLPKTPARVYVSSDDQYFGGRVAYHLYPHNAFMNRAHGAVPPPDRVKPGEYVVFFRRRSVQYDAANKTLSWDQQTPVPADILIAHQGNAAFRLR